MRWQFWQSSNHNEVPENVKTALASQFHLEPSAIGEMRVLTKSGQYSGRPVRFILVFDPTMTNNGSPSQLKYEHVEKGDFRKALLFECRIEKTGQIYLSDRRPKAAPVQNG